MTETDRRYVFVCPKCEAYSAREVTKFGDTTLVFHCDNCETTWTESASESTTLDDVVLLLGRIADALEAQVRPNACGELHKTGAKCVLDDRHVGHHTSGDGRLHWLDED